MLHLVTPLYRPDNLEKIYNSIMPFKNITWHIVKSYEKEISFSPEDPRVIIYNSPCSDKDPVCKRNYALEKIKDGYFHLLDDDTELHPNMYSLYVNMRSVAFEGMVIGKQQEKDGKLRLRELDRPLYCYVDAGNVLSHHSAIEYALNTPSPKNRHSAPDYDFWENVYNYYKRASTTKDVISTYNSLK